MCKKSKKNLRKTRGKTAVCCGLRGRAGAEKLCKYLYKFGDMHYALADPSCLTPLVSVFIDYLFIFYIVLSLSLSVPIPHTVALLFYFIIHVAKKNAFYATKCIQGATPQLRPCFNALRIDFLRKCVCSVSVCVCAFRFECKQIKEND